MHGRDEKGRREIQENGENEEKRKESKKIKRKAKSKGREREKKKGNAGGWAGKQAAGNRWVCCPAREFSAKERKRRTWRGQKKRKKEKY